MNNKLILFLVCAFEVFLMLSMSGLAAIAGQQKACYLTTDQRDWGGTKLGAAERYLEAAEACHTGDHLTVSEIPVRQAGYFIISTCDPSFTITTTRISDILVSLTCVRSQDKELRQN